MKVLQPAPDVAVPWPSIEVVRNAPGAPTLRLHGTAAELAETAGLTHRVEVRAAAMTEALRPDEEFVLVIADPPWVPEGDTDRYPADPLLAIDGGPEGLAVARTCLSIIGAHLAPQGAALLQLGSVRQAKALGPEIERARLQTVEVRPFARGVVAHLELVSARRLPPRATS